MFRTVTSLFVLLLILGVPLEGWAQGVGKISGIVTDETGESLPGANVVVEGTSLGAATNLDGEYVILGVPVGRYDVTASFVGYQAVTIEGALVNSGATRILDFELDSDNELGEITVEYERPLIENDAIGAPRVVTGEDIENLPVRGVTSVAALQGGVVGNDNSGDLFIRGGRDEEVAYFVDGVRVTSLAQVAVNQQAIAEQEMLIGTIPPRYGDVQAGVISITTKSGGDRYFGSLEAITSEVLDPYGYNLGSISIGGPIVPNSNALSFFLSFQGELSADDSPYGVDFFELNDANYDALKLNPQVLRVTDGSGNESFVPFPVEQVEQALSNGVAVTPEVVQGFLGEGVTLAQDAPIDAVNTFTAQDFDVVDSKPDERREFTFNGNMTANITPTTSLRFGGAYNQSYRQTSYFVGDFYTNYLYNRDRFYNQEQESWRVFGTLRQRLNNTTFFQLQGEFQDYGRVIYPEGFSSDVEDALFYGDVNTNSYDTIRRFYTLSASDGTYSPQFLTDGGATPPNAANFTFNNVGTPLTRFQDDQRQTLRFSGNFSTQLGVHQLEIGGEWEKQTRRQYVLAGFGLSRFYDDPDDPYSPGAENGSGVSEYADLPYSAFEPRATYYGYNYLGTEQVDDENITNFFEFDEDGNRVNANIAPHEPVYFAGYISDKIEFRDLVIQLGARVDVFDNNTFVLRDTYAPLPIVRANELDNFGDFSGNGIEGDYAVYFGDNGLSSEVVGFRDLDGNFFLADGTPVTSTTVVDDLRAQVRTEGALNAESFDEVFGEYEAKVTFMPRIGVSFPVTDRALFFASYNVTSQRPTERAFQAFNSYLNLTQQNSRERNNALEPEVTTQYELGLRQRLGERAALTISGFYRTQENKISNRPAFGGFPQYGTYLNQDFTTTKGAELGFELRRTNNVAINANYTLSFAEGTGSDATATANIVWRGDYFPEALNPADFDQRHTINASVDYRLGDNEGPQVAGAYVLENFGVNILGQFGSGTRFTRLTRPNEFSVEDSFTSPARGGINEGTLPASTRLDLRVDRSFNLGIADVSLRAYIWVQNLLNTENVLAVYRATGLSNEDGFLETAGGQTYLGNSPDPAGAEFNYEAFTSGPINIGGNQSSGGTFFYTQPRRIRLGFLLNF